MEGARWDIQSGIIVESRLKELFPAMPVINIRVSSSTDIRNLSFIAIKFFAILSSLTPNVRRNFNKKKSVFFVYLYHRQLPRINKICETCINARYTKQEHEAQHMSGHSILNLRINHPNGHWLALRYYYKFRI